MGLVSRGKGEGGLEREGGKMGGEGGGERVQTRGRSRRVSNLMEGVSLY